MDRLTLDLVFASGEQDAFLCEVESKQDGWKLLLEDVPDVAGSIFVPLYKSRYYDGWYKGKQSIAYNGNSSESAHFVNSTDERDRWADLNG